MMDEKMMRVPKGRPRRRQRHYRKRFPGGNIAATIFAASICVYMFMPFFRGSQDEEPPARAIPPAEVQVHGSMLSRLFAESISPVSDDADWNLVLVNYESAIPENYEPDLAEVSGGEKVDKRIYEPLMEMLEAAKEGNRGQLPMVVSGYRTQAKQQQLFDDKVSKYRTEGHSQSEAEELAKQWVAVPGYSEHQIGLAVDINGAVYDLYYWLQQNSYKYGFIFRYPGSKADITGVAEEVWHYRYVGVDAATEMYEKGLCLEEYLAKRQTKK